MVMTRRRIGFLIIILLIFLSEGLFLRVWFQKAENEVGNQVMTISQVVAQAVDVEHYEEIVRTKNRDDYFSAMQDYFRKTQQVTGVKYLYVKHKISDTQIEYIFDAEKDSLGEKDDLFTPEAYTEKSSIHTGVKSYDDWGILITGYSPLINSKGEIVGTVGTDLDANAVYQEFKSWTFSILLSTLIVIFLLLVLLVKNLKFKGIK